VGSGRDRDVRWALFEPLQPLGKKPAVRRCTPGGG